MREHACLARAGAGDDQERTLGCATASRCTGLSPSRMSEAITPETYTCSAPESREEGPLRVLGDVGLQLSSLVGSGSSRHARSSRVWSALSATVNAPAASISSPK